MPVGDLGRQSLAHGCPPAKTGHLGVGPAFIHEDQAGGWTSRPPLMPMGPLFGHVRAVLLGGAQRFFYSSSPACAATRPPWRFGTSGPDATPTRPASRPAEPQPAFAAEPLGPRSAGSC